MKKNINWFGSPIPKPAHFADSHLHPCVELDESPTPRQTRLPNSLIFHPLNQNASIYPDIRVSSPQQIPTKREKVGKNQIEEILVYSQEEEEPGLITPSERHNKKQAVCTTDRKNQEQRDSSQKRTRPKDKGLKGVSARAFQLVKICKETSYKEMANLLLKEFNPQGTSESRTEEINIRRRVYDALNVFLALGILRKDGRRLVNDNPKKRSLEPNENQYEVVCQKMLQKEEIVKEKRSKLAQVETKLKNARELLTRNIKNKNEENVKHVPFPFIGIVGFADYQMEELRETSIAFHFNTMVFPFGDMDSLNYL